MNLFSQLQNMFSPSPAAPQNPKAEDSFQQNDATTVTPVDFSKLHEAPASTFPQLSDPVFTTDPAELDKAVKNFDFTSGESFDQLASQVLGQGADLGAFKQLLNHVVQQGVARSTQASAAIAENAAKEVAGRLQTNLPASIRDAQTDALLNQKFGAAMSNPAFSHTLQDVKSRISRANPNATPEQLTDLTDNFLTQLLTASGKDTSPKTVNGFPVQQSSQSPTFAYHDIFPSPKF
jgi:hypothetical protein